MHKKIVKAIQQAITQHTDKELIKVSVESKSTGGFWAMTIITHPEYQHLIPHIKEIGMSIGHFYGEGLHLEEWHNTIKFS